MEFPLLPPRPKDSHKGQFGHVGAIGGASGMVGAILLAGRAALKSGAGRVTLGPLDDRVAVDYGQPELMFAPPETLVNAKDLSVLALGPGMGQSDRSYELLGAALSMPCPLIVDADALNLLAAHPILHGPLKERPAPTLMTPHPGEAARLLGCTIRDIQLNRQAAAQKLVELFGAAVALKGADSLIARPDGTISVNSTGCPAMASPGMGDVLTGLIAALIAQGIDPLRALDAGVYLHGAAGEKVWKEKRRPPSVCATELIGAIPQLLCTSVP
jgi:ADP-dependent NAD(P)H-hydrate dehydratase / NAD(P)H-hydrate epimerase